MMWISPEAHWWPWFKMPWFGKNGTNIPSCSWNAKKYIDRVTLIYVLKKAKFLSLWKVKTTEILSSFHEINPPLGAQSPGIIKTPQFCWRNFSVPAPTEIYIEIKTEQYIASTWHNYVLTNKPLVLSSTTVPSTTPKHGNCWYSREAFSRTPNITEFWGRNICISLQQQMSDTKRRLSLEGMSPRTLRKQVYLAIPPISVAPECGDFHERSQSDAENRQVHPNLVQLQYTHSPLMRRWKKVPSRHLHWGCWSLPHFLPGSKTEKYPVFSTLFYQ